MNISKVTSIGIALSATPHVFHLNPLYEPLLLFTQVMQVYVQISDDYVAFMRQQRPDSGSDAADQPAEQQVGNGNDKCSGGGDNTGIDNGDGSAPEQDNNES